MQLGTDGNKRVEGGRREAKVPGGASKGSSCETGCNAEVGTAEMCRNEDPFQLAQDVLHPFAATDVGVVGSAVSSKSSQRCLRSKVCADRLLAGERTGSGGRDGDKHTNPHLDLRHQVFDEDFVPSTVIPFVRHVGKNRRDTKKDTCVSTSQCKQGHGFKHITTRAHMFA